MIIFPAHVKSFIYRANIHRMNTKKSTPHLNSTFHVYTDIVILLSQIRNQAEKRQGYVTTNTTCQHIA